jgi:hypothetical protein
MHYSLSSPTILASTTTSTSTNQSSDTLTNLPKLPADDDQHHEDEAADEDTKFQATIDFVRVYLDNVTTSFLELSSLHSSLISTLI